ncbi:MULTISPECIES: endonuclease NucS domain-containing protein [unclassified Pseudarthrobacter]|uniref:endonuclease NucS domain-containing protein n=1 Tax=unclassified Pseudarthrobacter TaxID=2647000 RepID=UPI003077D6AA
MTAAWMVRQGTGGSYAEEMIDAGYMGVDFIGDRDLAPHLVDGFEAFRPGVSSIFQETNPGAGKIATGLAVNSLWLAAEGISEGNLILAPKPDRTYQYGIVTGGYEYHPGTGLPHRRRVEWNGSFSRDDMSPALASSTKAVGTVSQLTPHAAELAALTQVGEQLVQPIAEAITAEVQEQLAFQLEKQLEDFLVHNWANTSLGREYDIYSDGEQTGQQYLTDTGPMDILAISRDRSRLLVVELKRGRASDAVVGQIQRYMGYVQDELLEPAQRVEGVIIAQEDDLRIRRALSMTRNIRFMKYRVEFHLDE